MNPNVVGVILAGGRSSRMQGEDKSFLPLGSSTLIERVIQKAKPQVSNLLISTNSDDQRYRELGLPLIADQVPDHAGPLAGIFASMDYATKNNLASTHLTTFPVDTPFCPLDLVERLNAALQPQTACADIVIPRRQGREHWALGLWSIQLADKLRHYLLDLQQRKMQNFIRNQSHTTVDFDEPNHNPFFNINSREDLAAATLLLD